MFDVVENNTLIVSIFAMGKKVSQYTIYPLYPLATNLTLYLLNEPSTLCTIVNTKLLLFQVEAYISPILHSSLVLLFLHPCLIITISLFRLSGLF